MLLIKALGVTFAILSCVAAYTFTGTFVILLALEHWK